MSGHGICGANNPNCDEDNPSCEYYEGGTTEEDDMDERYAREFK